MDDAYSGYSYTRYKKPRRVFPFVFLALFICISFFVSNLLFGFVNFKNEKPEYVTAPVFTFQSDEIEYTTKPRKIQIIKHNQRDIVEYLVNSFVKSCDIIANHPENARAMYNEIYDRTRLFESWKNSAWSADYGDLLRCVTRELFGLDLLSISRVAFAYYDFSFDI